MIAAKKCENLETPDAGCRFSNLEFWVAPGD
jgi:hypothetical protein